ncbi:hypothetical protein [Bombiscardovia coagulans]|uniref:Uncharacterized protein n=1 Tax=Bombiscardovia coagulans TaxID=686666 RepID=A0A261EP65_9BIFI|nr:hypothetical protein [Bombiscardovia coagulans]OZG48650.1 hypothetical protein BOCO_1346 [Bombiscardovia coagulans]
MTCFLWEPAHVIGLFTFSKTGAQLVAGADRVIDAVIAYKLLGQYMCLHAYMPDEVSVS